ncbi:transcriptional regulator opi1 [Elasticomyces elasticus]|nr:transcriptional regulator opi1 [Elasticomyces elasticus]
MEVPREQPPAYCSHDPETLKLPSVADPASQDCQTRFDVHLPELRTVLSPDYYLSTKTVHPSRLLDSAILGEKGSTANGRHSASTHFEKSPGAESNGQIDNERQRFTLPPLASSPRTRDAAFANMDSAVVSPTDTASMMSVDEPRRSTSVVFMEDPEVRLAAEALKDLGNPDFVRAPSKTYSGSAAQMRISNQANGNEQQEPLLALLAEAHPWVGGTINGSLSAYSTTKHYSPRFVQYGANLIERNIGSPVASTVSGVGRITGVENGIRRYLGGRRPSDFERVDSSDSGNRDKWSKRRRVMDSTDDEMDVTERGRDSNATEAELSRRDRGNFHRTEYLPPYGTSRPPSYKEEGSPMAVDRSRRSERPAHNRSWSTQLLVSTSGLGVALSESSLRSLQYCVGLLGKATEHTETVMNALKLVLREYDQAREFWQPNDEESRLQHGDPDTVMHDARLQTPAAHNDNARVLADRIKQLSDDIWNTMKTVVNSVSTYAGGALPENARRVVRGQLMSVPQRWRIATESAASNENSRAGSETSRAAHRMVAFATEGLDMMAQVSSVVKVTLDSAEQWLDSLGRRRGQQSDAMAVDEKDGQALSQQENGKLDETSDV